nr:hypothetical protein [Tanacetum cinerariifolium]
VKLEKDGLVGKLAGLLKALKNLDHLIESQRSDQKDLSWTGLPEFVDDTVTDYSRPSPTVVSTSAEGQNIDSSTTEDVASPNPPKPFVKHSNKRPKGNQRNWNNLKSYQLGPEFVLHKKPCFNCGDFSHLANECRRRVQRETTRSQNHPYKSSSHRSGGHIPHGTPMRPPLRSSGHRPHGGSMRPSVTPLFVKKTLCHNLGIISKHSQRNIKRRVQRDTTRSQNHPYKSSSHRSGGHRPHDAPMRPPLRSSGHRPHGGSMRPSHRSAGQRPHGQFPEQH